MATKPYMGLISATQSWNEDPYSTVHTGCQWELYGLKELQNYPLFMNYTTSIVGQANQIQWQQWQFNATSGCKYAPNGLVENEQNAQNNQQIGHFDLFYPN